MEFVYTPNKLSLSVLAGTFNHSVLTLSASFVLFRWYVLLVPHEYFNGGVVYKWIFQGFIFSCCNWHGRETRWHVDKTHPSSFKCPHISRVYTSYTATVRVKVMASVYTRRVCMPRTVRLFTIDFQNRSRVWLVLEGSPPHTSFNKTYEFSPYLPNTSWRCIVSGVRDVLRFVWRMIGYLLWPPLSPNKERWREEDGEWIVFVWCSGIASMKRAARNLNAVIHLVASRPGEWGRPKWDLKQLNSGIGAYATCMAKIQRQTDALRIFIFLNPR